MSKNVWAERKTAFLPNGILSFLYFHLPTPSLSSSSCLSLIACTRRDEFLDRKALAADCSVILQLLVDRTVQPSRKSVLSAFTPINRSDCYMSHKTTLWSFWKPISVSNLQLMHHTCHTTSTAISVCTHSFPSRLTAIGRRQNGQQTFCSSGKTYDTNRIEEHKDLYRSKYKK